MSRGKISLTALHFLRLIWNNKRCLCWRWLRRVPLMSRKYFPSEKRIELFVRISVKCSPQFVFKFYHHVPITCRNNKFIHSNNRNEEKQNLFQKTHGWHNSWPLKYRKKEFFVQNIASCVNGLPGPIERLLRQTVLTQLLSATCFICKVTHNYDYGNVYATF